MRVVRLSKVIYYLGVNTKHYEQIALYVMKNFLKSLNYWILLNELMNIILFKRCEDNVTKSQYDFKILK